MPNLEPQAALETAAANLMQASTPTGLGYDRLFCGRRYDGKPPPVARGKWYVAVWHDGSVQSGKAGALRTALDETFSFSVTITVELVQPFDRWVEHRDRLEEIANEVVALVQGDVYNNVLIDAANTLAGFRRADLAANATLPVGFYGGFAHDGKDALVEAGADWLNADPESGRCAIYQRLRFTGAARLQDLATLRG